MGLPGEPGREIRIEPIHAPHAPIEEPAQDPTPAPAPTPDVPVEEPVPV